MKLIEAVNAYLAAEEMSREKWPYAVALALVKVKRRVKDEVDFFVAKERELVETYAAKDERGNIRLTSAGTFVFKDPAQGPAYEAARKELCDMEIEMERRPIRVAAPAEIKPAYIEGLEGFVEFVEGRP